MAFKVLCVDHVGVAVKESSADQTADERHPWTGSIPSG